MSAIELIEKTVLALPVEQRVLLAESLLGSLPAADAVWSEAEELAEAERREREIASGQMQPLDEAQFWRRVEAGRKRRESSNIPPSSRTWRKHCGVTMRCRSDWRWSSRRSCAS